MGIGCPYGMWFGFMSGCEFLELLSSHGRHGRVVDARRIWSGERFLIYFAFTDLEADTCSGEAPVTREVRA
jgi:hypothetical protein